MDRSERLIKPGDSWFSSKAIEVAPRESLLGVEHCAGEGVFKGLPNRCKLRIPRSAITGDTRRVIRSVVKRDTAQTDS